MVYDARLQKGNVSCLIISDNSLFVCKICVPVISILYLGIIANGLVPFISGQGSLKVNFSYNFFFCQGLPSSVTVVIRWRRSLE